jgi:hypothetical protein
MQAPLSYDQIVSAIYAGLPQSACSIKSHDHYNEISVEIYRPDGRILFYLEPAPVKLLQEESILASRIDDIQWLLSLTGAWDQAPDRPKS